MIAKRKARGKTPIVFKSSPRSNIHHDHDEWMASEEHAECKAYSALVESLLDDEDNIESEFSMLKCAMIEDGTYIAQLDHSRLSGHARTRTQIHP